MHAYDWTDTGTTCNADKTTFRRFTITLKVNEYYQTKQLYVKKWFN